MTTHTWQRSFFSSGWSLFLPRSAEILIASAVRSGTGTVDDWIECDDNDELQDLGLDAAVFAANAASWDCPGCLSEGCDHCQSPGELEFAAERTETISRRFFEVCSVFGSTPLTVRELAGWLEDVGFLIRRDDTIVASFENDILDLVGDVLTGDDIDELARRGAAVSFGQPSRTLFTLLCRNPKSEYALSSNIVAVTTGVEPAMAHFVVNYLSDVSGPAIHHVVDGDSIAVTVDWSLLVRSGRLMPLATAQAALELDLIDLFDTNAFEEANGIAYLDACELLDEMRGLIAGQEDN